MSKLTIKQQRSIALAETINSFKTINSDSYGRLVPDLKVTELGVVENFDALSDIMLNTGYTKLQNEFLSALINKIGLTLINAVSSSNPLSVFKKGSLPKGTDVEIIFTNPAKAEDTGKVTDANQAKLYKTYTPDVKVAYIRMNRGEDGLGDTYPVTITDVQIKRAFQNLESMDDFIGQIVSSLTAGDTNDEFIMTKKIIAQAVNENKVVIEAIASDVTSEASLKALIAKMRARYFKMKLSSSKNNAYNKYPDSQGNPAITSTPEGKIALIMTADLAANVDVGVLAASFHLDKTNFLGRVVVVDQFDDNLGIQAVLCDDSWLQIYDGGKRMEDARNARTQSTNYFLHCPGIFSLSPFANAIAYVINNAQYLPDIAATAIVPEKTTLAVGETINFRLTPTNSTETVTVDPTSVGDVIVDNDNKTIKAVAAGAVNLEIDGTPAVDVDITVTA